MQNFKNLLVPKKSFGSSCEADDECLNTSAINLECKNKKCTCGYERKFFNEITKRCGIDEKL